MSNNTDTGFPTLSSRPGKVDDWRRRPGVRSKASPKFIEGTAKLPAREGLGEAEVRGDTGLCPA